MPTSQQLLLALVSFFHEVKRLVWEKQFHQMSNASEPDVYIGQCMEKGNEVYSIAPIVLGCVVQVQ